MWPPRTACIPLTAPRWPVSTGERRQPRARAEAGDSKRRAQACFPSELIFQAFPFIATARTLTVRVLQLGHGGHERLLRHMAGRLLHERLLVRAVQLLGELHRLQGRQAAGNAVDHGHALRLRGVQTWEQGESRAGVSALVGADGVSPSPSWEGGPHGAELRVQRLLCAMAMTPESGVMMRFWDCCGLWWDKLWMLVRVLTGGSPPPETGICQRNKAGQPPSEPQPRGRSRPPALPALAGRLRGVRNNPS